jgi:esterase/lipase superfamily enzyme
MTISTDQAYLGHLGLRGPATRHKSSKVPAVTGSAALRSAPLLNRTLGRLLMAGLVLLTAACGQRGDVTVDPSANGIGTIEQVFVGTTRTYDPETKTFGSGRSPTLSLAEYDISVPPNREPGEIKWPKKGRPADPRTEFVTAQETLFPDAADFRKRLGTALRSQKTTNRRAMIFVHGFNNTFGEGLYRVAQLSHDLDQPVASVHYSWSSAAQPLGYVHDRDSSLFARDGLEALFYEVIAAGAQDIVIVGHSMGAHLAVETLRQMDIRDSAKLRSHLAGVVLLSPDIDVEVFKSQVATFGKLPQPFVIISSSKDKALRLSSVITGQPNRLGNLDDIQQLAQLDVRVIDVAAFSTGSGHFNIGDSPELIALLSGVADRQRMFGKGRREGLLQGEVRSGKRASTIVLSPSMAMPNEPES